MENKCPKDLFKVNNLEEVGYTKAYVNSKTYASYFIEVYEGDVILKCGTIDSKSITCNNLVDAYSKMLEIDKKDEEEYEKIKRRINNE